MLPKPQNERFSLHKGGPSRNVRCGAHFCQGWEHFGMKLEAPCALLLSRRQQYLVSEFVWLEG